MHRRGKIIASLIESCMFFYVKSHLLYLVLRGDIVIIQRSQYDDAENQNCGKNVLQFSITIDMVASLQVRVLGALGCGG